MGPDRHKLRLLVRVYLQELYLSTNLREQGSSERQPPANQPGQMSTPDDLKRATALYASQTRQNDQQASATSAAAVYKNVYVLLKVQTPS